MASLSFNSREIACPALRSVCACEAEEPTRICPFLPRRLWDGCSPVGSSSSALARPGFPLPLRPRFPRSLSHGQSFLSGSLGKTNAIFPCPPLCVKVGDRRGRILSPRKGQRRSVMLVCSSGRTTDHRQGASTTEACHLTAVGALSPRPRGWQGWFLRRAVKEPPVPGLSPWLVDGNLLIVFPLSVSLYPNLLSS